MTWVQTPLTWTFSQITAVQRLVINPVNPSTVYAATSEGTYRSRNAGASWSQVHAVPMAMDLVINASDTTRLFVACGSLNSTANPGLYYAHAEVEKAGKRVLFNRAMLIPAEGGDPVASATATFTVLGN